MALLTGDDVFERETRQCFPDAAFVVVKTAGGRASADTLSPVHSRILIRDAARGAVERYLTVAGRMVRTAEPVRAYTCELHAQNSGLADLFAQWPQIERVSACVLRFTVPSAEHLVRMLNCFSAMSAVLR